MPAVKIAPSFLTADLGRLADEVRAVEEAGADYLHLDIMDGHFVPPISFGEIVVEAVRTVTSLPLDVHLMVERPEDRVERFVKAGSDIVNVHVEATSDVVALLATIRELGARAGVCISPPTPLSAIESALDGADQVMVMAVNPGWGGQAFIPETLPRVRELRAMLDGRGLTADIEIDGGVKTHNAAECARAGANVLVAGSVVFNARASVAENMRDLRAALGSAEQPS